MDVLLYCSNLASDRHESNESGLWRHCVQSLGGQKRAAAIATFIIGGTRSLYSTKYFELAGCLGADCGKDTRRETTSNRLVSLVWENMNSSESAHVLYVDHQGHPAPLSLSYHATASRRLASAIERHPPSTITEVDSAYCPQSMSFYDATTAANIGYSPDPASRLCPMCGGVASVVVDETDCMYKCDDCHWTSKQCGMVSTITVGSDGSISKEDVDKAAADLGAQWTERMDEKNRLPEKHFKKMRHTLEAMAKEQVKGQRSTLLTPLESASGRRGLDGPEGWSVQSLEDTMAAREKLVAASIAETVGGQNLQKIPLDGEKLLPKSLGGKPVSALLLHQSGAAIGALKDLLPSQIPLRPRKSRRCRAELAEGRPGILVKPKLNPLEGDSSLRTGHGQWWKKDSSAIQVLPQVRVSVHASDDTKHAFLFKVSNPTLGVIRLRLSSSSYKGEPVWGHITRSTPVFENLLLDPLTQECVNVKLLPGVVKGLEQTKTCSLEPSEDTFLELGKSAAVEPEEVSNWDASDVLFESKVSEDKTSTLRLVAQQKSCAWFELVLLETKMDDGFKCGVPIALQIEVGDGSWESSLIQPVSKLISRRDFVTFHLVVVWENLDG